MILEKLKNKFVKRWYPFEIPMPIMEKYNVKYLLADFSGKRRLNRKYDKPKDSKKFRFYLKLTEEEKREFTNLSKIYSKEQKVPLYTFRCQRCKRVFIMAEFGNVMLHKNKNEKIITSPICFSCV